MANKVAQKTFKVELEITVDMHEVGEEHLSIPGASHQLPHLKRLQEALLSNEAALTEQMLAVVLGKLQEYLDYVVNQDDLSSLEKVVNTLDREDRKFFEKHKSDFAGLTRPMRRSCLSVRLDASTIHEMVNAAEAERGWQPVWNDLLPESELSKLLEKLSISVPQVYSIPRLEDTHYLLPRYLTRQRDGVHMKACCTCGNALEGVGENESQALEAMWMSFIDHYEERGFRARRSPDNSSPGLRNISKS